MPPRIEGGLVRLIGKDQVMVLVNKLNMFFGLPLPRLTSSQGVKLSCLLTLRRLTRIAMKRVKVKRSTFQKMLKILTLTVILSQLEFNS